MNVLNYKGYQGIFDYDPEADIFHGEVTGLSDVITFQGRSIDELKEAMRDSIEDYLEFCKEKGKIPEKQYSGKFNVRITPDLHRRMATEALKSGKSLNQWLQDSLNKLCVIESNGKRP